MIRIREQTVYTEAEEVVGDPGYYKVVKVGEQWRFSKVGLLGGTHQTCVDIGETALSACDINVYEGWFWFASLSSSTLKVYLSAEDEEELELFLGIPVKQELW